MRLTLASDNVASPLHLNTIECLYTQPPSAEGSALGAMSGDSDLGDHGILRRWRSWSVLRGNNGRHGHQNERMGINGTVDAKMFVVLVKEAPALLQKELIEPEGIEYARVSHNRSDKNTLASSSSSRLPLCQKETTALKFFFFHLLLLPPRRKPQIGIASSSSSSAIKDGNHSSLSFAFFFFASSDKTSIDPPQPHSSAALIQDTSSFAVELLPFCRVVVFFTSVTGDSITAQVLAAKRATGFNYSAIQLQQYSITAEFNYIPQHYNQPNRA
ncbi:hypothetical protein LXL04_032852 [Taraxacum kok-saghyz]